MSLVCVCVFWTIFILKLFFWRNILSASRVFSYSTLTRINHSKWTPLDSSLKRRPSGHGGQCHASRPQQFWWFNHRFLLVKCRETIHPAKVLWVFHAEQTVQCGTHYRETIWHFHMFFCYVVKKLASTLPVKTGQTVIWVNKCLSWPLHETGRTGTIPYWGQIRISSQKNLPANLRLWRHWYLSIFLKTSASSWNNGEVEFCWLPWWVRCLFKFLAFFFPTRTIVGKEAQLAQSEATSETWWFFGTLACWIWKLLSCIVTSVERAGGFPCWKKTLFQGRKRHDLCFFSAEVWPLMILRVCIWKKRYIN